MKPENGTYWESKQGLLYRVLVISNSSAEESRKDEYPETITYERITDGSIWSRKLISWHDNFKKVEI